MHDVSSLADNDRPILRLHVISSIAGESQLQACLHAGAGGVHAQPQLVVQAVPEQNGPGVCRPGDSQR